MRNLTTSPITDATGKVVQLVSATTGEQHEHITVSDLSKAVSDNLISSDSPNGIKKGTDGKLLVDPADLISTDAGNAIIEGTDGKLYRSATAVINDDQVLTGDTSTNTAVTLTPATVPDSAGGSQTNYTIKAEVKIDGVTITENASKQLVAADQTLNVLPTVQPTPTATGNTTNLNTTFKDASGTTWIVDKNGDAIIAGAAIFKEQKQWHVDKNGNDTTGTGADENPVLTVTKALSLAPQANAVVVTEGTYAETVTMSVQNVTLRGEGNEYGGLTEINALNVTTTSGTSNRVSSLTVLGNVAHTGGAPFYLSDVTINGNYASSSTAYDEIRGSRIQTGTISKTGAGILNIVDSYIGNATFSTANSIIALDNVTIDAGKTLTIGAGVIYSLNDVRGHVVINAGAIPAETAALAGGLTGLAAKSVETSTFNDIRLTNVPTITGATKALVRDTNGVVSEQVFPSGLPSGGTDGQVLTVQPDGSYAWETPSAGSTEVADGVTILGTGTAGDPFRVAPEVSCGVVYFDAATPAASTIFSTDNPPTVDGPALHDLTCATYVSAVDGSFWSSNGTAYATKVFSFQGASDEFVATANRTSFVLTGTPIGKVWFFRNGARLPNTSFSVIGSTVTYIPVNNGSAILGAMVAGDVVDIDYVK